MTEWFISFLGKYAKIIIDFYRENQEWLNIVILGYGILLAWAHRNTVKAISILQDITGKQDLESLLETLKESGINKEMLAKIKSSLVFPFISSRYHLYFNTISEKEIIQQIEYKIKQEKEK